MTDSSDFDGVRVFPIKEHAIIAAAEAEARERGLQLFDIASAAGEVAVHAVKNLHSKFTVDGAEIGAGFRRPADGNALGRGLLGFGHFFTPNSRRISSWGIPSPRASEARARSRAATVSGGSSSSSTGALAREKGSSIASSRPTTAESCAGGSRSISSWACSLVSVMSLPLLFVT